MIECFHDPSVSAYGFQNRIVKLLSEPVLTMEHEKLTWHHIGPFSTIFSLYSSYLKWILFQVLTSSIYKTVLLSLLTHLSHLTLQNHNI